LRNYLLDPRPITRIIISEGKEATESEIEKLILDCCKQTLKETKAIFTAENVTAYKDFSDDRNFLVKGAEIADKYIEYANSSNDKLKAVVSGDKALSKLLQRIQTGYGLLIMKNLVGCATCHYPQPLKIDPDTLLYELERLHAGRHYNLWWNHSARDTRR